MTIYHTPSAKSTKLNKTLSDKKRKRVKMANLSPQKAAKKYRGWSLRLKIMAFAIAIGTIPVGIAGAIAYQFVEKSSLQQANRQQLQLTKLLAQKLNLFLEARLSEVSLIQRDRIFTNSSLRDEITLERQKAALENFQERLDIYDSIIYFDLAGNPLFQTKSERPILENYRNRFHFKQAIATKQIKIDKTNIAGLEYIAPIKDAETSKIVGVICFRISPQAIGRFFAKSLEDRAKWYFLTNQGLSIGSTSDTFVALPISKHYPQIETARSGKQPLALLIPHPKNPQQKQLISYAPIKSDKIDSQLNLGTIVATNPQNTFASLLSLRWLLGISTIATSSIVGAIAAYLANRFVHRIKGFNDSISHLGMDEPKNRNFFNKKDELDILGTRIDLMAEQLNARRKKQERSLENAELIAKISQARSYRELQLPFNLFLAEVRSSVKGDRAIFLQLDGDKLGTVIAESVASQLPRTLGMEFEELCFNKNSLAEYRKGKISTVVDVERVNLNERHLEQLKNLSIKASLILPVIVEGLAGDNLVGLLIVHQCHNSRVWQELDIDYLQQIAYQLGITLRGYFLFKQEQKQKETLQKDLTRLDDSLTTIAEGNLTVKADFSNGAIKDILHTLNISLKHLTDKVAETKTTVNLIGENVDSDCEQIAYLNNVSNRQANRLVLVFTFIEQMVDVLQEISQTATATFDEIDSTIDCVRSAQNNLHSTIADNILLHETLTNTVGKIKQLKMSSRELAGSTALIRQINLRNSLLVNKIAQNSPLESSEREIARKKQELANQSVAATKELMKIGHSIESQTTEILRDLEFNTAKLLEPDISQAIEPTLQQAIASVESAKHLVLATLDKINTQIKTGKKITQLKLDLDLDAELISQIGDRSLNSLQQTIIKIQNLQQTMSYFQTEN